MIEQCKEQYTSSWICRVYAGTKWLRYWMHWNYKNITHTHSFSLCPSPTPNPPPPPLSLSLFLSRSLSHSPPNFFLFLPPSICFPPLRVCTHIYIPCTWTFTQNDFHVHRHVHMHAHIHVHRLMYISVWACAHTHTNSDSHIFFKKYYLNTYLFEHCLCIVDCM